MGRDKSPTDVSHPDGVIKLVIRTRPFNYYFRTRFWCCFGPPPRAVCLLPLCLFYYSLAYFFVWCPLTLMVTTGRRGTSQVNTCSVVGGWCFTANKLKHPATHGKELLFTHNNGAWLHSESAKDSSLWHKQTNLNFAGALPKSSSSQQLPLAYTNFRPYPP